MKVLLSLAVALIAGLFMSRITKKLKMPAVTAYLVAGILIGPYGLGLLMKLLGKPELGIGFASTDDVKNLSIITDVALGFIAFTIGNEFRVSQLKTIGKKAVVISFFEALTASLVTDIALISLHFILGEERFPLYAAIILGAIACATAPAATLMVVKQYKAKGAVTDLLLPIVALDDAIGLMVFAVCFGVGKAMTEGTIDVLSIVVGPILEIVASLALGALMGVLFTFAEKFFESRSKRLTMSVTFVLLTVGLAKIPIPFIGGRSLSFSPLLVCMMLGTVFCNMCDYSEELLERVDRWSTPVIVLFFVLSGADLELSVFNDIAVVGIGLVYIIFRCVGKYTGAWMGASTMKCEPNVRKYLGITLFPQAGVALGMCLTAANLGSFGPMIRNIVLFGVLVYELLGPTMTKIALTKSGDIQPKTTEGRPSLKKNEK